MKPVPDMRKLGTLAFIEAAREHNRYALINTHTGRWLREALIRLEDCCGTLYSGKEAKP